MHNNAKFLRDRTGRSMRTSPIFPKMRAAGARFNQTLKKNRYMLMSPSVQQMKSYTWMKYHLPSNVILQDVTSLYTALCIMGPHSRALLSKLTLENLESLDQKSFPFFTCRYMNVGCAPNILTMNLTHTGELGYVMYIPNEFAVHVYDTILSEGDEFGISQCGYYAMRALRIEKFFAFWGQDLDSHSTPLEQGGFTSPKKEEGLTKLLVMLLLDPLEHDTNVDPWPWGEEPIYRNGKFVGTVTTSSFGFSLKRHVVLGFLHHDDGKSLVTQQWIREGNYEIDIAGRLFPAHVKLNPPVLPTKVEGIYTYTPTRHSGS
ncbi:PDPR [Lepeophtheirus salmonis]|uniref:PDPR n=1 Tax=Lepeophtheirus salmonis TaxID=72036 RepID=A0A7R8D1P3_LEPSM|nr:PDPR [Lepeophtheirus salmonis]CAF2997643.1 PDPR [Lepeophtheirus salmonis]